ncbi:putative transcriptional regulator, TetR family protein [Sphingomonas sp. DBB INV C78]|uniref:TetR/AcrR family transcriptional regulator n=1 Tax=Sphingomonas sp. DBB INV C78 TaxID=3349434 RepID=UPI0036D33F25
MTRARLIRVAECLFAEKGVQSVSLNEINKVAEQRHGSACQYHFGNKKGLIQAILDKHGPDIAEERDQRFDRLSHHQPRVRLEEVVAALVEPVATKLLDLDGGKDFVRLIAQMIAVPTLGIRTLLQQSFVTPRTTWLNEMLAAALADRDIPSAIADQRLMVASVMLYHGLAGYSYLLEATGSLDEHHVRAFSADLQTMVTATLVAPIPNLLPLHVE